jgi:hypothetical protein
LVRVPFSARLFKKSGLGRGYHRQMLINFSVLWRHCTPQNTQLRELIHG